MKQISEDPCANTDARGEVLVTPGHGSQFACMGVLQVGGGIGEHAMAASLLSRSSLDDRRTRLDGAERKWRDSAARARGLYLEPNGGTRRILE